MEKCLFLNKYKDIFKEYFSILTLKLAFYDFSKIYKGSFLGVFWTFFKPVFSSFIFFLGNVAIYGGFIDLPSGFPGWAPLILGMIVWQYLSDSIGSAPNVIHDYSFMVTKMHFKKNRIYFFTNVSKFLQHLVLMVIFFIIYSILVLTNSKANFSVAITQLIFVSVCMILFFICWTIFIAPLCVISRDVKELVALFIMCAFWVSGTFFDTNTLISQNSTPIQRMIYQLVTINPLATIILIFRASYFGQADIILIDGTNAADYTWFFQGHFYQGYFIGYWYKFVWIGIWAIILLVIGLIVTRKTKSWINDLL